MNKGRNLTAEKYQQIKATTECNVPENIVIDLFGVSRATVSKVRRSTDFDNYKEMYREPKEDQKPADTNKTRDMYVVNRIFDMLKAQEGLLTSLNEKVNFLVNELK